MSTAPAYIPTHGTLADRVTAWFRANPDEELNRSDIATKFGVLQSAVSKELQWACLEGSIEYVPARTKGQGVFRLTRPAVIAPAATPTATPTEEPAPQLATPDLVFSISPQRQLQVSFFVPEQADPQLVLAAMLTAAAHSIGKTP